MMNLLAYYINTFRRKDFEPLEYSTFLLCTDCQRHALIKYFIGQCDHVVCVFCKATHDCNLNSS